VVAGDGRSWSGSGTYIQYDVTGINVRRYWPDSQWAGSRTSQDRVLPGESGPRVNAEAEAEKPEWEFTGVTCGPVQARIRRSSPVPRVSDDLGCVMGYYREVPRTAEEGGPSDRSSEATTMGAPPEADQAPPTACRRTGPPKTAYLPSDRPRPVAAFAEPVKMHSILMEGLDLVFRAGPQAYSVLSLSIGRLLPLIVVHWRWGFCAFAPFVACLSVTRRRITIFLHLLRRAWLLVLSHCVPGGDKRNRGSYDHSDPYLSHGVSPSVVRPH
jgi:hypothetical protein